MQSDAVEPVMMYNPTCSFSQIQPKQLIYSEICFHTIYSYTIEYSPISYGLKGL